MRHGREMIFGALSCADWARLSTSGVFVRTAAPQTARGRWVV